MPRTYVSCIQSDVLFSSFFTNVRQNSTLAGCLAQSLGARGLNIPAHHELVAAVRSGVNPRGFKTGTLIFTGNRGTRETFLDLFPFLVGFPHSIVHELRYADVRRTDAGWHALFPEWLRRLLACCPSHLGRIRLMDENDLGHNFGNDARVWMSPEPVLPKPGKNDGGPHCLNAIDRPHTTALLAADFVK
jgi:hypothetical protein